MTSDSIPNGSWNIMNIYESYCHLEESVMVEWPWHHDIPCLFSLDHGNNIIWYIPRASGFQIRASWNRRDCCHLEAQQEEAQTPWVQEEQGSWWRWLTSAKGTQQFPLGWINHCDGMPGKKKINGAAFIHSSQVNHGKPISLLEVWKLYIVT